MYLPRDVFIDLDITVIDEVRTHCQFLHPEELIMGKEDPANKYPCENYTISKETFDPALNHICKLTDLCNGIVKILTTLRNVDGNKMQLNI